MRSSCSPSFGYCEVPKGHVQADPEVVLAAVRQNRMALRYAAEGLMLEPQGVNSGKDSYPPGCSAEQGMRA